MGKRREKSALAFSRLPPTAAPAVPVHQRASNTVRLKPACSGFQMKTIRRLDELRSIRISVLAVRSVRAKDLTERFWMDVRGTRSRWYLPTIGNHCTGSFFLIYRLPHQLPECTICFRSQNRNAVASGKKPPKSVRLVGP